MGCCRPLTMAPGLVFSSQYPGCFSFHRLQFFCQDNRFVAVEVRLEQTTADDGAYFVTERNCNLWRPELWFRINVFPITVPPLRERASDLPALVHHFIQRKARELKIADAPQLVPGATDDFMGYDWPANVREFENVLERAMIPYHRGEPLTFDDLGFAFSHKVTAAGTEQDKLQLDAAIARHIRQVLGMTD